MAQKLMFKTMETKHFNNLSKFNECRYQLEQIKANKASALATPKAKLAMLESQRDLSLAFAEDITEITEEIADAKAEISRIDRMYNNKASIYNKGKRDIIDGLVDDIVYNSYVGMFRHDDKEFKGTFEIKKNTYITCVSMDKAIEHFIQSLGIKIPQKETDAFKEYNKLVEYFYKHMPSKIDNKTTNFLKEVNKATFKTHFLHCFLQYIIVIRNQFAISDLDGSLVMIGGQADKKNRVLTETEKAEKLSQAEKESIEKANKKLDEILNKYRNKKQVVQLEEFKKACDDLEKQLKACDRHDKYLATFNYKNEKTKRKAIQKNKEIHEHLYKLYSIACEKSVAYTLKDATNNEVGGLEPDNE